MTRSLLARMILTLGLLSALFAGPVHLQSSQAQTEQLYLALGDSIPAGLLASLPTERGYPALLRDLMEAERLSSDDPGTVELINLARAGETIQSFQDDGQLQDALSEIETAPAGSLRTVTLTIGGNNILPLWEATSAERDEQLQEFEAEYNEVIDQLASALGAHDADVVVTTYYDLTEGDAGIEGSNAWWLRQFNNVIRDAAREAGFAVVDLESLFEDRIGELTWFPADIHPGNAGHQFIARSIWRELSYDQTAPDVEITRPDEVDARSRVPTIHASVTDNVEIDSVMLQIDSEDSHDLIYVPDRDAWIGVWDARDVERNEATLTVVATDVSGNESRDSVTISLPSR